MLFRLQIPYLLRMKNYARHADLFVRLFARAITIEVPPPKVLKFQQCSSTARESVAQLYYTSMYN